MCDISCPQVKFIVLDVPPTASSLEDGIVMALEAVAEHERHFVELGNLVGARHKEDGLIVTRNGRRLLEQCRQKMMIDGAEDDVWVLLQRFGIFRGKAA